MEEINKETQQSKPAKNKWFAGYIVAGLIIVGLIVAGLIWIFSQSLVKNSDKVYNHPTVDNNVIISGSTRENFVRGVEGSCLQKQINDSRSVSRFSEKVLSDYCSCYANGIADQITLKDINLYDTASASKFKKMLQPKIDLVSPSCKKTLQGK